MSITVDVYDAKTRLSALLASVEAGEEVIIARSGKPVARLVGMATHTPERVFGAWRGRVAVGSGFDDFTAQDGADWYATPAS